MLKRSFSLFFITGMGCWGPPPNATRIDFDGYEFIMLAGGGEAGSGSAHIDRD